MLFTEISRKQAFVTHFSVSMAIFVVLAYLIIVQWYPSFYFTYDGGGRGIMTVFFVDVILGPGLTLLVFKQGKKGLKFDMAMILVFQIIAMSWGVKSVYLSRPSLTVFYNGQFACLTYDDIASKELERLSQNHSSGPLLVILKRPDFVSDHYKFISDAFRSGSSEIYLYGDRFEMINEDSINRIKSYELDVEEGIARTKLRVSESKESWEKYKQDNPVSDGIGYYPLKCRYKVGMVAFDFSKGKVIDYVDVYTKPPESNIKLKYRTDEIKKSGNS